MLTIISRDDPPAIYYAQPTWPTVLRADIEGFFFNPINIGTYDFWKLSRTSSRAARIAKAPGRQVPAGRQSYQSPGTLQPRPRIVSF